jgi:hypothetical protein
MARLHFSTALPDPALAFARFEFAAGEFSSIEADDDEVTLERT